MIGAVGNAVRSASRGITRVFTGRKEEEPPRSKSIITEKKAGFGYHDLTEVVVSTETSAPSKYASKYSIPLGSSPQSEYGSAVQLPTQERPRGGSQPRSAAGWNMLGSEADLQKGAAKKKNYEQAGISEDKEEEFEVINNLTHISKAVKTPEEGLSILQKTIIKRATGAKQPKISESPVALKVSFFYLVGSNCMPDDLRIPWYLKVMSSTMVASKGTEVLAKLKSPATKGPPNTSTSLITDLRMKDIKTNWKKQLNSDIPDHVLLRIEMTLKQNELCKQGPPSSPATLSTFIKFYSLWAMVLYKPLQRSIAAINRSRSMLSKSELFVDYAGNKIPPNGSEISGIFEGVWTETIMILQADRFLDSGTHVPVLHPGNVCYGYIARMISKSSDRAERISLLQQDPVRKEIYNAISTLQKNFFFWEESQEKQPVNSGYMLDLFVLLQGKLVIYLVAKIIANTKCDDLKEWAASKIVAFKLLAICKDLVVRTSYDQVTELLDFEFIQLHIYQTGAKN